MNKNTGVLVTGAGGFIGSCIARYLLEKGYRVRCTARRAQKDFPDFQRLDLLAEQISDELFSGMRVLIHTAGIAHRFKDFDPEQFKANATMTVKLAEKALSAGLEHFILLSSVAVYGAAHQESRPIDEAFECNPRTPYALSKYDSEQELLSSVKGSSMRVSILRLATVHGEGDPGNLNRLLKAIENRFFLMPGSGANFKSLIYKEDVARACELLISEEGGQHEIFNLATENLRVREIVDLIYQALGRGAPLFFIPDRCLALMLRVLPIIPGRKAIQMTEALKKWRRNEHFCAEKFVQRYAFEAETGFAQSLHKQLQNSRKD